MSGSALSRRVSEFVGVALFAAALFWLIALASYDPADTVWFFSTGGQQPPANFSGRVGAFLAELSYQVMGFSAYLLPVGLVPLGWHAFWCRPIHAFYTKLIGLVLTVGCTASFLSLAFGVFDPTERTFRTGGYVGGWLANIFAEYLNRTGSIIVILTLLFLALILTTQLSFGRLFSAAAGRVSWSIARSARLVRGWWKDRRRHRERQEVLRKHLDKSGASSMRTEVLAKAAPVLRKKKPARRRRADGDGLVPAIKATMPEALPLPLPEPVSRTPAERRQGAFTLPPLSLLDPPREKHKFDERELMDSARLLEEKCREFSVEGAVVQIHPGPVVTTFEFKPDAGVKYSKVTGLADDLCLAMQAESVLIERLPGKSTVGIQIPNRVREQISLRQMLESEPCRQSSSKLMLALGRTIHGDAVATDLASMPHLLIAGSTGTGKSVAMNAMLTSILYRATPDEVRLILIDPKRLELGMYEDIPHLLTPVVVEPKLAANALRWAVRQMEERYKKLAAEGVRNLEQYNRKIQRQLPERPKKLKKDGATGNEADNAPAPLPSIVLAIDELADLMMASGNEVEESIARLAQMARAVGIHLILATQRPSVDVITGLIKANLPSRIAFRVSSKVDSRTIIDSNGAEQLLGRGDMLYLPPSSSRVIRVHGPYISEQETARVCGFLRKQGSPAYDGEVTAGEKQADAIAFDKDDLYDDAARLVVAAGQASISYLQRRLRIGFSRAARLVDMMEADGLVSASAGGKAREVLVAADYFDQIDMQLR